MRPTWTWIPGALSVIALAGVLLSLRYLLVVDEEEAGYGVFFAYGFGVVSFALFAVSGAMTFILAKPTGSRPRLARRIGLLLFCGINVAVGVLILVASGLSMFGLSFIAVGGWAAFVLVRDVRPKKLGRPVVG